MTYDYSNDNNFLHFLATWYSLCRYILIKVIIIISIGHFGPSSPWLPVGSVPSFGAVEVRGLQWLGAARRQAMLTWCGTFARRMIWRQVEDLKERRTQKFWRTPKYKKRNELWYSLGTFCEFCEGGMGRHKIQSLSQAGVIHTDHVEQAMLKVDRSNYAPRNAYTDAPQPLGHQAGCGRGRVIMCTIYESILI